MGTPGHRRVIPLAKAPKALQSKRSAKRRSSSRAGPRHVSVDTSGGQRTLPDIWSTPRKAAVVPSQAIELPLVSTTNDKEHARSDQNRVEQHSRICFPTEVRPPTTEHSLTETIAGHENEEVGKAAEVDGTGFTHTSTDMHLVAEIPKATEDSTDTVSCNQQEKGESKTASDVILFSEELLRDMSGDRNPDAVFLPPIRQLPQIAAETATSRRPLPGLPPSAFSLRSMALLVDWATCEETGMPWLSASANAGLLKLRQGLGGEPYGLSLAARTLLAKILNRRGTWIPFAALKWNTYPPGRYSQTTSTSSGGEDQPPSQEEFSDEDEVRTISVSPELRGQGNDDSFSDILAVFREATAEVSTMTSEPLLSEESSASISYQCSKEDMENADRISTITTTWKAELELCREVQELMEAGYVYSWADYCCEEQVCDDAPHPLEALIALTLQDLRDIVAKLWSLSLRNSDRSAVPPSRLKGLSREMCLRILWSYAAGGAPFGDMMGSSFRRRRRNDIHDVPQITSFFKVSSAKSETSREKTRSMQEVLLEIAEKCSSPLIAVNLQMYRTIQQLQGLLQVSSGDAENVYTFRRSILPSSVNLTVAATDQGDDKELKRESFKAVPAAGSSRLSLLQLGRLRFPTYKTQSPRVLFKDIGELQTFERAMAIHADLEEALTRKDDSRCMQIGVLAAGVIACHILRRLKLNEKGQQNSIGEMIATDFPATSELLKGTLNGSHLALWPLPRVCCLLTELAEKVHLHVRLIPRASRTAQKTGSLMSTPRKALSSFPTVGRVRWRDLYYPGESCQLPVLKYMSAEGTCVRMVWEAIPVIEQKREYTLAVAILRCLVASGIGSHRRIRWFDRIAVDLTHLGVIPEALLWALAANKTCEISSIAVGANIEAAKRLLRCWQGFCRWWLQRQVETEYTKQHQAVPVSSSAEEASSSAVSTVQRSSRGRRRRATAAKPKTGRICSRATIQKRLLSKGEGRIKAPNDLSKRLAVILGRAEVEGGLEDIIHSPPTTNDEAPLSEGSRIVQRVDRQQPRRRRRPRDAVASYGDDHIPVQLVESGTEEGFPTLLITAAPVAGSRGRFITSNEESVEQMDSSLLNVEQLVLQVLYEVDEHSQDAEWVGCHCEGSVLREVCFLLLYEALFHAENEGSPYAFLSPMQSAPLDLFCESFLEDRPTLERRIQEIGTLGPQQIFDELKYVVDNHFGERIVAVSWDIDVRFRMPMSDLLQLEEMSKKWKRPFATTSTSLAHGKTPVATPKLSALTPNSNFIGTRKSPLRHGLLQSSIPYASPHSPPMDVTSEDAESLQTHAHLYGTFIGHIAAGIGGPGLSTVCRTLCSHFTYWRSGLPDLVLWRIRKSVPQQSCVGSRAEKALKVETPFTPPTSKGSRSATNDLDTLDEVELDQQEALHSYKGTALLEVRFLEVKGPGDCLSEKQRQWLKILHSSGVSAGVALVRPKKS